jgi:hypothetical protein
MAVEGATKEEPLLTIDAGLRWSDSFVNISPPAVRWSRASERGIIGMVPEPVAALFGASTGAHKSIAVNLNGYSLVDADPTEPTIVDPSGNALVRPKTIGQWYTDGHNVAQGLNAGQVSRLIKIARDWSKQAEEATTYRAEHTVEDGVLILEPAPTVSFDAAFASYVVDGNHRLVSQGGNGEHRWFTLWRLRAARTLLQGASAHAILDALRNQLAELRAGLASFGASAARTHASQLVRLSHYIVPNAPPAHLVAQVT